MKRVFYQIGILLVALIGASIAAHARGEVLPPPPPPPFTGGSTGDWLGSGPIFGFDHSPAGDGPGGGWGGSWFGGGPWGPNRGTGGSGTGSEWGGGGGSGGSGSGGDDGSGGLSNECDRHTVVTGGPNDCQEVCHCALYWYNTAKPKKGTWATGICEEATEHQTTNGNCHQVGEACLVFNVW